MTLQRRSRQTDNMKLKSSGVNLKGFSNAEARWARFGPYYAMFPIDFAFDVVEKYSQPGDYIIDPFSGRGSSIYAGGVLGRHSLGIEINPVGWLYSHVKLKPADLKNVSDRLLTIYSKRNYYSRSIHRMPLFYRMCYCDEVLKFLLAARKNLNWRNDDIDATLMSVLLVYLHGKIGEGLSNQMKMTKAMGINYSIEWWKKQKLGNPPQINPFDFILKRLEWRYKKGKPAVFDSRVVFGDSTIELEKLSHDVNRIGKKFSLLFTSPPYYSITDYYADQWIRLWLLGGPEEPKSKNEKHKSRFASKENYFNLLNSVFHHCAKMMKDDCTVYVRTDRREYSYKTTLEILKKQFPDHFIQIVDRPFKKRTQTEIHGNKANESGEKDIILFKQ